MTTNRSNKNMQSGQSGSRSAKNEERTAGKTSQSGSKSSDDKAGPGRGWHGDPEGHARAGSQSHKND